MGRSSRVCPRLRGHEIPGHGERTRPEPRGVRPRRGARSEHRPRVGQGRPHRDPGTRGRGPGRRRGRTGPGVLLATEKIPSLKVLIDAPLAVRAKRIASREATTVEDAKREILARERSERIRYKSIYGIDVGDTRIFDLVIDSRDRTPDEIVAMIAARVRG